MHSLEYHPMTKGCLNGLIFILDYSEIALAIAINNFPSGSVFSEKQEQCAES